MSWKNKFGEICPCNARIPAWTGILVLCHRAGRSSHPQPQVVTAPVYRGCPAGTHWGDDSSRQDDEPSERQLCAVLVLSWVVS